MEAVFIGLMLSRNPVTINSQIFKVVLHRSGSIHTIDYNGRDHREMLRGHRYLARPFAITVFGDHVYWTDWRSNSIVRVSYFPTEYCLLFDIVFNCRQTNLMKLIGR
jgi:hypothetical protein